MRPLPLVLALLVVIGGVVAFVLFAGGGANAPDPGRPPAGSGGTPDEPQAADSAGTKPAVREPTAPPPAVRATSPVVVRVVSRASLAPVASARLRAGGRTWRTDAKGAATVPGGETIEVVADGFVGATVRTPVDTSSPARIALPAAATVAGRVVDPTSSPVAGARVRVVPLTRDLPDPEGLVLRLADGWTGVAAADGRFAVIAPSAIPIAVEALGGVTAAERYASPLTLVPGQRTDIQLTMHPAGVVRGRLVDGGGNAIAAGRVSVRGAMNVALSLEPFERTVGTDATGGFEISPVPLGAYRIEGVSPASRTELAATVVAVRVERHGQVVEQTVTLHPGRYLTGTVEDPDGARVADVAVVGAWPGASTARTDQTGAFRIGPVPPGRYRLRALGRGALGASRWSDTPDDDTPVQLRLTRAGRVAITVADAAGKPVAASVELRSIEWSKEGEGTRLLAEASGGKARFEAVAEGRYVALVYDKTRLALDGPFAVAPDAETKRNLTLKSGAFTTIVVRQPADDSQKLERVTATIRCDGIVIAAAPVGALKTIQVPAGRKIAIRVDYRQGGADRHVEHRLQLTSGLNEFVEVP